MRTVLRQRLLARGRESPEEIEARLARNAEFAAGLVPCSGQPCQKQPSMNTATRGPRNTMSARRLRPTSGAVSTR